MGRMWEKRNGYKILVGKREGNRPHVPRGPRLEDNGILRNWPGRAWAGFICITTGAIVGLL